MEVLFTKRGRVHPSLCSNNATATPKSLSSTYRSFRDSEVSLFPPLCDASPSSLQAAKSLTQLHIPESSLCEQVEDHQLQQPLLSPLGRAHSASRLDMTNDDADSVVVVSCKPAAVTWLRTHWFNHLRKFM